MKNLEKIKPIKLALGLIVISISLSGAITYIDKQSKNTESPFKPRIKLIFDTDANNELDDQHALAYLLFNNDVFDLKGVTVNTTKSGGNINAHYDEAHRVTKLCKASNTKIYKGADADFVSIKNDLEQQNYDGKEAVDFLIEQTKEEEVIILAVGKLTNVALALKKDPDLAHRTKIVWLGSNYPNPGEYNLNNDTIALNYILKRKIPFEMVTVRYRSPSGSGAVKISQDSINHIMPGLGPHIDPPITGRHGGQFHNFGDYSVSLFKHIEFKSKPHYRSLFDLVAAAVLKNENWGQTKKIAAPLYINGQWVNRITDREIIIWEHFNRNAIIEDFLESIREPALKD